MPPKKNERPTARQTFIEYTAEVLRVVQDVGPAAGRREGARQWQQLNQDAARKGRYVSAYIKKAASEVRVSELGEEVVEANNHLNDLLGAPHAERDWQEM